MVFKNMLLISYDFQRINLLESNPSKSSLPFSPIIQGISRGCIVTYVYCNTGKLILNFHIVSLRVQPIKIVIHTLFTQNSMPPWIYTYVYGKKSLKIPKG